MNVNNATPRLNEKDVKPQSNITPNISKNPNNWFLLLGIIMVIVIFIGGIVTLTLQKIKNQNYNQRQNQYMNNTSANNQGSNNFGYGSNKDFAIAGDGGDSSAKDLPACTTNAIFDHLPTSDVDNIGGMGLTYAEHILPVQDDHIYLNAARNNSDVIVYSPGNVTLVQVVVQKHTAGTDAGLGTDYAYFFSACKSIMFGFIHMHTLSDRIKQALTTVTPKCGDQGTLASNCVYQDLGLKLSSGEAIGTAWGNGNALDFGGTDVRTPALGFINKQGFTGGMLGDSYFHTICPLDYFTSSLKNQLYSKIIIKNAGANGIPACGLLMQDKAGTAQGNWYQPGISNTSQGDNLTKLLALAHYNLDPSQAVLSAGSKLLPSSSFGAQIIYQPRASGFINRDPADIKPDGHIYCIEGQVTVSNSNGHVDIQMPDTNTLNADYGQGSCVSTPMLSSSITYSR